MLFFVFVCDHEIDKLFGFADAVISGLPDIACAQSMRIKCKLFRSFLCSALSLISIFITICMAMIMLGLSPCAARHFGRRVRQSTVSTLLWRSNNKSKPRNHQTIRKRSIRWIQMSFCDFRVGDFIDGFRSNNIKWQFIRQRCSTRAKTHCTEVVQPKWSVRS